MSIPTPEPSQPVDNSTPALAAFLKGIGGDKKYAEIAAKVFGYMMESSVSWEILQAMHPGETIEAQKNSEARLNDYFEMFFQEVQKTGLQAAEIAASEQVKRLAAAILIFSPLVAADVINGESLINAIIHAPLQVITSGNAPLKPEAVNELMKAIHGDHEAMANFWKEFGESMGDKMSDVLWEVLKDVGIVAFMLNFLKKKAETADEQREAKAEGEGPVVVPQRSLFLFVGNGSNTIDPLMAHGAGSVTAIPLASESIKPIKGHPGYIKLPSGDITEGLERLRVSPDNLLNGALLMVGLAEVKGQELRAMHDFSIEEFVLAMRKLRTFYEEHHIPVPQTVGIFIGHADAQATDDDGNPITAEQAAQDLGINIFADIKDFLVEELDNVLKKYPDQATTDGVRVVAAETDAREALKARLEAKGIKLVDKPGESKKTVCIIAHADSARTLAQALNLRDGDPDRPIVIIVSSITIKDEREIRERKIDIISIADVTHGAVVQVVGMFQNDGSIDGVLAELERLKLSRRATK